MSTGTIPYHPIRALQLAKDMNPRPRKGGETDGEGVKKTHHLLLSPTKRGNEAGVSCETWLPQALRRRESKNTRTERKESGGKKRDGKRSERRGKRIERRDGRRRGARGSARSKNNATPRSLQTEPTLKTKTDRIHPQMPPAAPTTGVPLIPQLRDPASLETSPLPQLLPQLPGRRRLRLMYRRASTPTRRILTPRCRNLVSTTPMCLKITTGTRLRLHRLVPRHLRDRRLLVTLQECRDTPARQLDRRLRARLLPLDLPLQGHRRAVASRKTIGHKTAQAAAAASHRDSPTWVSPW